MAYRLMDIIQASRILIFRCATMRLHRSPRQAPCPLPSTFSTPIVVRRRELAHTRHDHRSRARVGRVVITEA